MTPAFWISNTIIPRNLIKVSKTLRSAKGRFWLVGLIGRKMIVAISNSFCVVFLPNIRPHTKKYKMAKLTSFSSKHSSYPMACEKREQRRQHPFYLNSSQFAEKNNWSSTNGRVDQLSLIELLRRE